MTTPPSAPSPRTAPGSGQEHESLATLLSSWAARLDGQIALTHVDYSHNPDGHAVSLTWRELDDRVSAVAARLVATARTGDRAAVLIEQSVDYVVAFVAAIRAGLVAVPLFPPTLGGHSGRLAAVLADCAPDVVLTTSASSPATDAFLARLGVRATVLHVDGADLDQGSGTSRTWHRPNPDDVAYLQYTSGSTRTPAGVVLSHRNVVANARQAASAYGIASGVTSTVSWLPLFHDMGLILGIGAPLTVGVASLLMDPLAFLEKPVRWLRALSDSPGAISAAPNFAYSYTAARVHPGEAAYLELSRVVSLVDGSEPLQPESIGRFREAFEPCGLRPEAHRPSYGLAEATVLVAASDAGAPPIVTVLDREQLAAGKAVPAGAGPRTELVACGRPAGQFVRIVDPETGTPLPSLSVGEVWVSGENVGRGYWGRPDESASVFERLLPETGERRWLATGDLGVMVDGRLHITGRMKDLIIVDGRNHYPQDIEQCAEENPAIRKHSAGAFSISAEHGMGEVAVLVVEQARGVRYEELAAALPSLRRVVAAQHGLMLRDVVVLAAGQVPRTSSGKISRARCRARYLDGTFAAARVA